MVCVLALFSITTVLATFQKIGQFVSKFSGHPAASGLYYKNITIVNDTYRVVRMMPQLGASLTRVILATLEVSFILPEL